MIECSLHLDSIFGCLADFTRRDILMRVANEELSVSEIAKPYRVSLAAISKHLRVLERARLIVKRRKGKRQLVQASPAAMAGASHYLKQYERMWNDRFDRLEQYVSSSPH